MLGGHRWTPTDVCEAAPQSGYAEPLVEKSGSSDFVARLYEQVEARAAQAGERLVGSGAFAVLLGQMAENTAALTKLSGDAMDLIWHNLRVAGRRDVIRLARQLSRTEDKLERLLQEIEALRDALDAAGYEGATQPSAHRPRASTNAEPQATSGRSAPVRPPHGGPQTRGTASED